MRAVTPSPRPPAGEGATPQPAGTGGDALVRLFDDYHQRLFRLARRLSTNHDEARDLVQETFVRVLLAKRDELTAAMQVLIVAAGGGWESPAPVASDR